MTNSSFSEQEEIRRSALQRIRDLGINPYPPEEFPVNSYASIIINEFSEGNENFQNVCLAGRLMNQRIMGKASFAELQDSTGRIQLYVNRDELCPGEDKGEYPVNCDG